MCDVEVCQCNIWEYSENTLVFATSVPARPSQLPSVPLSKRNLPCLHERLMFPLTAMPVNPGGLDRVKFNFIL